MKRFYVVLFQFFALMSIAQNQPSQPAQAPFDADLQEVQGAVVHQVFFWLKNPDSLEDKAALKEGLATLRSIPEVQWLLVGEPASTLQREVVVNDWHVSELMVFQSAADQDSYQSHPLHAAFVEKYSALWEKVVVYDSRVD